MTIPTAQYLHISESSDIHLGRSRVRIYGPKRELAFSRQYQQFLLRGGILPQKI